MNRYLIARDYLKAHAVWVAAAGLALIAAYYGLKGDTANAATYFTAALGALGIHFKLDGPSPSPAPAVPTIAVPAPAPGGGGAADPAYVAGSPAGPKPPRPRRAERPDTRPESPMPGY